MMNRVRGHPDVCFSVIGDDRVAAVGVAGVAREVAAGYIDFDLPAGAECVVNIAEIDCQRINPLRFAQSEHDAENFVFDPDYLGIHRSDDLVLIQITWNEGRSVEQKKVLYKAIADGLATRLAIWPEDVFINLVEVKKENWSFGNGVAQYAS